MKSTFKKSKYCNKDSKELAKKQHGLVRVKSTKNEGVRNYRLM